VEKMEDLLESLERNQILIYVVSGADYLEKLIDLFRKVSNSGCNNIVYLTLNRSSGEVLKILEKNQISEKSFSFIDATQKNAGVAAAENTASVDPSLLTDISIQIFNILEKEGINVLVVDPISTLLIYNPDISVMKFLHFVVSGIRQTKNKAVFLFLKEDSSKPLFNDLSMFSDKIVKN
jgi:hypothetical protein